jgi:uncharacterized protein
MGEIHDAIEQGEADRVASLARENAAVGKERDENGVSALMLALYRGRRDLGDLLLEAGPELDVFEASAFGKVERVRELVEGDAELLRARSSDTFTPLHYAAFFGQPDVARVLVERGADPNAVADGFDRVTPLHSACAAGDREIAAVLLEHGADPNARESGGFTPLHAAAQNGDEELAKLLLARGADPEAATEDGRKPRDLGLTHSFD